MRPRRAPSRPSIGTRSSSSWPSTIRSSGELPEAFPRWSSLERAAYLELTTLLEPYLLAAQGDRVAMAHGVEGRYPFLDHRVFEHSVQTPPLRGLEEKVEFRDLARAVLPAEIAERPTQPYCAPDVAPFFTDRAPDWVGGRLCTAALREAGCSTSDASRGC